MDKEAVNAPKEDEFHSLIKSIDIDNYLYVMPIIEEQKITLSQFKSFDRYYLDKLFEIGSFNHLRELGREVQFIEKFSEWKKSANNLNNESNNPIFTNDESSLNYNLNHVFITNPIYCEFKSYYDKNGHLGNSEQNKLTRAIFDFFVSKNINLDSIKLKNLASQIHQLFPNEAEEVYFEKQKHQRAKGKLFYRHQNAMKSSVKPITKPIPYIEKKIYFLGNEQDASKIKSFLKYNF
ncbi:hypothetical protein FF38_14484 [Lucilia cuprina]|uniref:Uncharacterized protein n=1 Tax=Lucilia cuprina TaxID=7375 RepID=A0A0L0C9A0_LUCCU|nr:hypothetical protein FF38_14484 [Lucilia cuprina]